MKTREQSFHASDIIASAVALAQGKSTDWKLPTNIQDYPALAEKVNSTIKSVLNSDQLNTANIDKTISVFTRSLNKTRVLHACHEWISDLDSIEDGEEKLRLLIKYHIILEIAASLIQLNKNLPSEHTEKNLEEHITRELLPLANVKIVLLNTIRYPEAIQGIPIILAKHFDFLPPQISSDLISIGQSQVTVLLGEPLLQSLFYLSSAQQDRLVLALPTLTKLQLNLLSDSEFLQKVQTILESHKLNSDEAIGNFLSNPNTDKAIADFISGKNFEKFKNTIIDTLRLQADSPLKVSTSSSSRASLFAHGIADMAKRFMSKLRLDPNVSLTDSPSIPDNSLTQSDENRDARPSL
jgi:hypothetical protein